MPYSPMLFRDPFQFYTFFLPYSTWIYHNLKLLFVAFFANKIIYKFELKYYSLEILIQICTIVTDDAVHLLCQVLWMKCCPLEICWNSWYAIRWSYTSVVAYNWSCLVIKYYNNNNNMLCVISDLIILIS